MEEKYIFIAYIEENSEIAELIWERLRKENLNPWAYTKNRETGDYRDNIMKAIENSQLMILIFSKETDRDDNRHIHKELGEASDTGLKIIPFMIDDIKRIQNRILRYELGRENWIFGWKEPIEEQIDTLILKIKESLHKPNVENISSETGNLDINAGMVEESKKGLDFLNFKYLIGVISLMLLFVAAYFAYMKYSEEVTLYDTPPKNTKDSESDKNLTTNEDPSKIPTLSVTNKKDSSHWGKNLDIKSGDKFAFQIHYYGWHQGINDLRVVIDDLNNTVFKAGEEITVKAMTTSKNLLSASGKVNLSFVEPVKLILKHILWKKKKCKSSKCITTFPEDPINIFTEKGLYLGDLAGRDNDDYYGNIIVAYDVVSANNSPASKIGKPTLRVANKKREASLHSPADISPLSISRKHNGNWSKFVLSQDIELGDKIALEIHAYANNAAVKKLKLKLNNITQVLFEAGTIVPASVLLEAANASPIKGSVSIRIKDRGKLVYEGYKWAIKKEDGTSKEIAKELPKDQHGSKVFLDGILLGDLTEGYRSNLILYFWLKKVDRQDDVGRSITTNQSPNSIPTLEVSNKRKSIKRWQKSVHIDSSEILSFQIHYYTGYTGAINLRAKMDNLEGRSFNVDDKLTVNAEVLADNLNKSIGTAEVVFDEDVKLKFHRLSWQKTNCQATECESLIADNMNNLFLDRGISLGNVPKDNDKYYNGNLVVEYKAIKKDGAK